MRAEIYDKNYFTAHFSEKYILHACSLFSKLQENEMHNDAKQNSKSRCFCCSSIPTNEQKKCEVMRKSIQSSGEISYSIDAINYTLHKCPDCCAIALVRNPIHKVAEHLHCP